MDQLDEEMEGKTQTVIGHLAHVVARDTREHRRYLISTLELLAGSIEVMVWPDALERTADCWQEGTLIQVTGRIRMRGDQFSLACDQVGPYDFDSVASGAGSTERISSKAQSETNGPKSQPPQVANGVSLESSTPTHNGSQVCLLYTSDAADE